jgi:cytochrome c oxidase subunit IV
VQGHGAPAGRREENGMDNVAKVQPPYMIIWGVLAVLMMAKVGIAFLGLPKTATIVVLCTLAVWKATLVALYYMHLKFEPRRMWLVAAAPLPLAVILVLVVLAERF